MPLKREAVDWIDLQVESTPGVVAVSAVGASAPSTGASDASYVTLAAHAGLTNERVLTAGTGITLTDAGAGSTLTISASIAGGLAAQFLTLAASGDLTSERVFTPGDGIDGTDAGAGAAYTVAVDVTDLLGNGMSETANNLFCYALRQSDDGGAALTADAAGDLTMAGDLTVADDNWIGLGAAAGRIEFDNQATDEINLLSCNVGVGTQAPAALLHLSGATEQLRVAYNATDYASFTTSSTGALALTTTTSTTGGNLTLQPAGDLITDPVGNDILPATAYDINIGMLTKKYLTLHVAELWVETLVAQETVATIGGRILVGPTTMLTRDLTSSATMIYVKHNEMTTGDVAYLEANGLVEFITITSTATASAELLTNPGFESVITTGWTRFAGTGAIDRTTAGGPVHSGTYHCRLTAGSSYNTYVKQAVTVTPEAKYRCQFWTKGDDSTYAGRFKVRDATHSMDIVELRTTYNTRSTYGQVSAFFTAPAGCTSVEVYLYCPPSNTTIAYFDDISIGLAEWRYNCTRNLDGTGANDWSAGDAVFNTGQTGDGFIDLYSLHAVNKRATSTGPTIVGNVRNTATWNDWSEYWAIGNLNGLYGNSSSVYGVGLGPYRSGVGVTSSYVTIDATNGIQFFSRDNVTSTCQASWSMAGVITLGASGGGEYVTLDSNGIEMFSNAVKVIDIDSSGDVALGQVATNQGNVFWNCTNKRLEFRGGTGGTTVQAYIDTDGSLCAGTGTVELNSAGLSILASTSTSYMDINSVVWRDASGNTDWKITAWDVSNHWLVLASQQNHATYGAITYVGASNASTGIGRVTLHAENSINESILTVDTDEIWLGATSSANARIVYTGAFAYYNGSSYYTTYAFHPLTTPLTSTSWDGDSFSDVSTATQLDMSAVFGVPAGVKAVLLQMIARDSGTFGTNGLYFACGPSSTYWYAAAVRPIGIDAGAGNGLQAETTAVVPCDSNGDIWYQINASGSGTMDIWLRIWGYWI